jgi:hypothetical protein
LGPFSGHGRRCILPVAMPDLRRHRGAHPRDRDSFAEPALRQLRLAVEEYSWLLGRNYAPLAALKLVGDHHQLLVRQRLAVTRVACSDAARSRRRARCLRPDELARRTIAIDAFNAIIALEVALGGGLGLIGRDGARRDLGSVHGTYRKVLETPRALELLVRAVCACEPAGAIWYLDRPVSNSGKLAAALRAQFELAGAPFTVELVEDTDRRVSQPGVVAASADSGVIEAAERWIDLAGWVVREHLPDAWTLDFSGEPPC